MSEENRDWPPLRRVRLVSVSHNPTNRESLFGGSSLTQGENTYEEKITIQRRKVVWSAGSIIRRQFSFYDSVKEVKWCQVPDRTLCIFRESRLTFYTPTRGLMDYPITERNSIIQIWPLPSGLLLQGLTEFYYLRDLFSDYEPITFYDVHNEVVEVKKVIWTSLEIPLIVTSDQSMISIWKFQSGPLHYEDRLMFTPDSKRRSMIGLTRDLARSNANTLTITNRSDNIKFPAHFFNAIQKNELEQDKEPRSPNPRILSPRRRFEQDQVLHNEMFFHFSLKKTVLCITDGDGASDVAIAGNRMGDQITIAVHCKNRNRVYFFTVDKATYVQCKFEKCVDEIVAITSFSPYQKLHIPNTPNNRFFLRMDTRGGLAIYQGLARVEDINMALILPAIDTHEFREITLPPLLGVESSPWHEAFKNVVGNKVDIRLRDNLIGRFEIDIYPKCEVAADCFAIIKSTSASEYKNLFKMWIRRHLCDMHPPLDDWNGFCTALHAVLDIHFIHPESTSSQSPNEESDAMKQRLSACFGSYKENSIFTLHALHDLYESYKLDMNKWHSLQKLGHLLCSLSVNMGAVVYLDYYSRDFTPEVLLARFGISMTYLQNRVYPNNTRRARLDLPFDMQSKLQMCLTVADPARHKQKRTFSRDIGMRFGVLRDVFMFINSVGRKLKRALEREGPEAAVDSFLRCAKELVERLVSLNWDKSIIDSLPFGCALPIQEFIRPLREHPPECWTPAAYVLIGREDLVCTVDPKLIEEQSPPDHVLFSGRTHDELVLGRPDIHQLGSIFPVPSRHDRDPPSANQRTLNDGLDDVFRALDEARFSRDDRLQQIRQSLNTTLPHEISVGIGIGTEEGAAAAIQTRLRSLVLRTLATSIGRGAFSLGTVTSSANEINVGPPLCLTGTVPDQIQPVKLDLFTNRTKPKSCTLRIDLCGLDPEEAKKIQMWPEFHNAVSAALKIKPEFPSIQHSSETAGASNRATCMAAGYHLARGLQGKISKSCISEISNRLGGQNPFTQAATILGLSISLAGQENTEASECIFQHLPQYQPQPYPEADWCSPMIQTAALMSVGVLYRESRDCNMTKRMLTEIGRRPGTPLAGSSAPSRGVIQDREGFALAAGFALGIINLGAGNELTGYYYDKIITRLRRYMLGGLDPYLEADNAVNWHLPSMEGLLGPGGVAANPAFGQNVLFFNIPPLNIDLEQQGPANDGNDDDQLNLSSHSDVVLESKYLDTAITSPAATFALALFFLKTNNEEQARFFKIPETEYELDLVRYDFVLLRVLAKAMVLWDGILPTEEWIQSMLPPLMTRHLLESYFDDESSLRLHSIGQAHIHGIAGACLAIGLRFASTRNEAGRLLIRNYLLQFIELESRAIDGQVYPLESYGKIDKQMLESIISVLATSLGILMAGSGHLATYETLESLRRRLVVDPSFTEATSNIGYGDYMAVSMAIGFLFLGGGQQGFKTDNASIAALLISVYPRWPQFSTDNRCHLQLFRHLYAMAAENRTLSALDVDKQWSVYAKIKITMKIPITRPAMETSHPVHPADEDQMAIDEQEPTDDDFVFLDDEMGTPCLLPERRLIESLSVIGPRYYNCTITGKALDRLYETMTLLVKKRDSVLTYEDDESGIKMLINTNTNQTNGYEKYDDLVEYCTKHEVSEVYAGFARTFCSRALLQDENTRGFGLFCRSILAESMSQSKPEAIRVYLQIRKLIERLINGSELFPQNANELVLSMTNLRMVCAFYKTDLSSLLKQHETVDLAPALEDHPVGHGEPEKMDTLNPLIRSTFLHTLQYNLDRLWKSSNFITDDVSAVRGLRLIQYFTEYGAWPRESSRIQLLFACFLAAFEVAYFKEVKEEQLIEYCNKLILSRI